MKVKLLFISFLMLFIFAGCKSKDVTNKEKYDSVINQVITLENKRLQKDNILSQNEILKREDTGIIVYSEGKYIELIYTINKNQIESFFKYDEKDKKYELFPNTHSNLEKAQKYLEQTSYTENIGLK